MITDRYLRNLDECMRAVQYQLAACARTKAIDPKEGDLQDPAWCLAVETTCLLQLLAETRGKRKPRVWFA